MARALATRRRRTARRLRRWREGLRTLGRVPPERRPQGQREREIQRDKESGCQPARDGDRETERQRIRLPARERFSGLSLLAPRFLNIPCAAQGTIGRSGRPGRGTIGSGRVAPRRERSGGQVGLAGGQATPHTYKHLLARCTYLFLLLSLILLHILVT